MYKFLVGFCGFKVTTNSSKMKKWFHFEKRIMFEHPQTPLGLSRRHQTMVVNSHCTEIGITTLLGLIIKMSMSLVKRIKGPKTPTAATLRENCTLTTATQCEGNKRL